MSPIRCGCRMTPSETAEAPWAAGRPPSAPTPGPCAPSTTRTPASAGSDARCRVLQTASLQLVHHREPEPRALGLLDPPADQLVPEEQPPSGGGAVGGSAAQAAGHYAYYAITGNHRALARFCAMARRTWWRWLLRRSPREPLTWTRRGAHLRPGGRIQRALRRRFREERWTRVARARGRWPRTTPAE